MGKTIRNAVTVGLLTVGIVVAIYVSAIYLSEEYGEDTHPYYAMFDDATGLVERSEVKMAGIPVGSISSIRLENGKARIDVKISSDYTLYKNAIIAKRSSSLVTGDYYLHLTPGTPDRKPIHPGGRIPNVEEGTQMEAMASRVDDITKDVKQFTSSIADVFGSEEGKQKIAAIVTDLRDIADNMNKLIKQNSELIERTVENVEGITRESRPELKEILSNVKDITSDIKELIKAQEGDVGETVTDLKGSVKTLNSALEKLDRTLGNVEEVSEDVREGKGTIGKLVKDEDVAESVADAAEGAGSLLRSIGRLQTIVSLRTDYNFLASTLKTYVAIYIQPKEDKFYLIEIVDEPRGKTTVQELTVVTTNPEEPAMWHEKRVKRTDAFKFSFMFGRRISFLTFRFGIKESSGGVGVDFFLLKDSLKIETDLYEFGANVYPRLRVSMALRFLRKIYILGGVDDILNKDRRDYFIGAQLRFNDEDLKAVLAFGGTSAVKQ
jgi:phospholipid/cholesterol/gamma-HCH transport system substrate-binding protein